MQIKIFHNQLILNDECLNDLKLIIRLFLFITGIRKSIVKNSKGGHLYLLLKSQLSKTLVMKVSNSKKLKLFIINLKKYYIDKNSCPLSYIV